MQCPRCDVELLMSVREGIEIDCCPQCGGIWLDHGELMKMIAAYAPQFAADGSSGKSASSPAKKQSGHDST